MGFLMFLARKMTLQQRENNINFQLVGIDQKLSNLTDYVSILSQDSISATDLATIPTSLFSQGLSELTNAHLMATQIAGQQFNEAMASNGLYGQGNNPYIVQLTQQKLYENARKQLQKQMQARMNEEEKSLQNKKTRLETQLKQIQTELQAMDQNISNGIKNQVATFGVQG